MRDSSHNSGLESARVMEFAAGKKILMVVGNAVSGDSRVIKSAQLLQNDGHQVRIIGQKSLKGAVSEETTVSGLTVTLVNSKGHSTTGPVPDLDKNLSTIAQKIADIADKWSPDIIYTHDYIALSYGLALVKH